MLPGQEIYTFFYFYGIKGILGIIVSSILIGITIYKTLQIAKEYDITSYKELLDVIIKNEKIRKIANIVINIFILISFYVMIAGFGAYLEQEIHLNRFDGSIILAILCFILFRTNIEGIVKTNEILIPVLIGIILFIGICNIKNIDFVNLHDGIIPNITNIDKNVDKKSLAFSFGWLVSGVLYASYNCILVMPMLIQLKNFLNSKKEIKEASFLVGIIVAMLMTIIYFLLINIDIEITTIQMPAIYAIGKILPIMKNVYGIIILISIFTTAISLGMSFLTNITISLGNKYYNTISIFVCVSGVLFSSFGFANLINSLYPILGIIGFTQIMKIYLQK